MLRIATEQPARKETATLRPELARRQLIRERVVVDSGGLTEAGPRDLSQVAAAQDLRGAGTSVWGRDPQLIVARLLNWLLDSEEDEARLVGRDLADQIEVARQLIPGREPGREL